MLKIFAYVLSAAAAAVALAVVIPKLAFGIEPIIAKSQNITPQIPKGSLMFVTPEDGLGVHIDDIVAFAMNESGAVDTQYVVDADRDNRRFIVRGGADDASERTVTYSSVIGVVTAWVPLLGYVIGFVRSLPGLFILGAVILALILLILLTKPGEAAADKPPAGRKVNYSRNERYKPRYWDSDQF